MQIRRKIFLVKPDSTFGISVERELAGYFVQLADLLNNGITFSDNFDNHIETVSDTGNAGEEFEMTHALNRLPEGFLIINKDKACIVYDSGTTWTKEKIFLKCDTANCSIKVMVF